MGKDPNKCTHTVSNFNCPSNFKEKGQNNKKINHHLSKHQFQHQKQNLNAVIAEDNKDLPIPLRTFIMMKAPKIIEDNEKKGEFLNIEDDDDDFDLMFSNSKETLVGSFHNASLGLPNFSQYS